MDNRNFRRNDRGPIRQRSQLAAFMDKNGIYLVMLVCLALIGVTAYFTLRRYRPTADADCLRPGGQSIHRHDAPTGDGPLI